MWGFSKKKKKQLTVNMYVTLKLVGRGDACALFRY